MSKTKIVIAILVFLAIAIGLVLAFNTYKKRVEDSNSNNNVAASEPKQENVVKEEKEESSSSSKTAVVYFSATGTTKKIADMIAKELDADIYEIVPKVEYTSEDLNYNDNETRATKEQNDDNARPEIKEIPNLKEYDTILLGYPIWWGNVPKIMLSLIDSSELDGKKVIPFCTSGSSSIDTSAKTLKNYSSKYDLMEKNAKRFGSSASSEDVAAWIKTLGLVKEEKMSGIVIEVNGKELEIELEDNKATEELIQKLKEGSIEVKAEEYGEFEKVGPLGFSLTKDDKQIETGPGDVVLYQGNKISIFYAPSAWEYTMLGKVKNIKGSDLKNILGDGDVTLVLKIK